MQNNNNNNNNNDNNVFARATAAEQAATNLELAVSKAHALANTRTVQEKRRAIAKDAGMVTNSTLYNLTVLSKEDAIVYMNALAEHHRKNASL